MTLEKIKITLHNAVIRVRQVFGHEAACCGYFKNPDGRLVDCDEWWGYQDCMFPGCGHYQLEHSDGSANKVLYVKPELTKHSWEGKPDGNAGCARCYVDQTEANRDEDCPKTVKAGDLVVDPVGCLNAGCEDCPKFWTKDDLHNFMQLLARARHHATHDMHRDGEQYDPNVTHVDTSVSIVVQVTTSVGSRDHDALNKVFEREGKLRDKFPDILFNFDVRFEPQEVKTSISE